MTRDAHLAAKPYLTEARRTMNENEWAISKMIANHIKGDKYAQAARLIQTHFPDVADMIAYLGKCKEYDNIPDDVKPERANKSADDPVSSSPITYTEEATTNNQGNITMEVNASNPAASVDPKQNKLLEARVLALQERCDMLLKTLGDCEKEKQDVKDACGRLNGELIVVKEKCDKWEEIANDKSQNSHFVRDENVGLREKVEELTKERDELVAACTKQESDLIVAKEELKDYPEKVAQAAKARYWEGVAKTYGALLKYLGMKINNNYDQDEYQACVDGKNATVNRITREIVEKSPKYIEQDKRIKKLWNDKSLLSRLIDNHVDRKLAEKIFQDYHKQGGE